MTHPYAKMAKGGGAMARNRYQSGGMIRDESSLPIGLIPDISSLPSGYDRSGPFESFIIPEEKRLGAGLSIPVGKTSDIFADSSIAPSRIENKLKFNPEARIGYRARFKHGGKSKRK